jgi:hypothetical protein
MVTSLTVAALNSFGASSNQREYRSPAPSSSNGINNGDFETGDFTGWTTAGSPAINSNPTMIYHGSYSAVADENTDIFYQPLNYAMSDFSVFGFAMLGGVSISDTNWHEIILTIAKEGLAPVRLHYVLRSTVPTDTTSDKFFYLPFYEERWLAMNRLMIADLEEKGITQYKGGTVTNITCQEGGVCNTAYDALALTEYDPLSGATPNAIVNGGFEYRNFTGWTLETPLPPYVTIIDYNRTQVYEGYFSALNHHYYEFFHQDLNFAISDSMNFGGVMLATVSVSDVAWHEIMLTIDEAGSGTVYLHYRLQDNQPSDTAIDKYFLVGDSLEQWYALNRDVWNDLVSKGLSPGSSWAITRVTCQQGGRSCTVYDALRLWNSSPQPFPIELVVLSAGVTVAVLAVATLVYLRRRGK